jgi:hypothetical protein
MSSSDIYRGYVVDYDPAYEGGYRVFKNNVKVYEALSYDQALRWIDTKRKEELDARD